MDGLRDNTDKLPPDRPLMVFCGVGQRGYYAARTLHGLGRDDVVNLAGGYGAYTVHQKASCVRQIG